MAYLLDTRIVLRGIDKNDKLSTKANRSFQTQA